MTLNLFNTLTRAKEEFIPINKEKIGMYVCGPTVYDRAHLGNARPVVVFDVLYRLLKKIYPNVIYVRNITDVDDKIIERSKQSGEPISSITTRTTQMYHDDMAQLNALPPDIEPRATGHIQEMIDLITSLINQGHAYSAEGHVLFDVSSMGDYGRLSGRSLDEMIAGARVEVAPYKRSPADFVLWKPSTEGQPGWESPFGYGRPGWHIECSAMSSKYLGHSFDIHGGGQDLIFPHHENEIAQSKCGHKGECHARYWVHNGHLMVNGEKMSKSLGNFFTVNEMLAKANGEAIRFYLLSTHYHQPLNWTEAGLKQSIQTMNRFYTALRAVEEIEPIKSEPSKEIINALCDDLNTPLAVSKLHDMVSSLNKADNHNEKAQIKGELIASANLLGLLYMTAEDWFKWQPENDSGASITDEEIENLVKARKQARIDKDFKKADEIRKNLENKGVILEDSAGVTIWRRLN